jgi:hypothetical protein
MKTTFKDVAGLEGAKEEIQNCRVSETREIHTSVVKFKGLYL